MEFTPEIKEVKERSTYFDFGVHNVQIVTLSLDKTPDGKEFVEIFFADKVDNMMQDSARLWFTTTKSANFAFNTLRSIYVHNAPEAKKDAARATIDKMPNTAALVEELKSKLVGKECWFTRYLDPTRTYTGADGIEKKSINKNVYGYEPKLQPELLPDSAVKSAEAVFGVKATDPTESWK